MITKKYLLFTIITVCYYSHSQKKGYCGAVEYTIAKNIAYDYKEDYRLIFNDSISYAEEININKSRAKLVKDNSDGMLTNKIINGRKNETPAFYYKNKDDFYFSEIWDNNVIIIKEDKFNWNWELHTETKKIGNFNCQKATITFRGRNYTAWFTNEIPVRYGPWKFQGLSGLILEVYDDDYFLHITTTTININDQNKCSIKFDIGQLENALNIKEYQKKRIELTKEKFARISSKLPKGSTPLILDDECDSCNSNRIEIFNEKN
jgi:GLPGLI family protein